MYGTTDYVATYVHVSTVLAFYNQGFGIFRIVLILFIRDDQIIKYQGPDAVEQATL